MERKNVAMMAMHQARGAMLIRRVYRGDVRASGPSCSVGPSRDGRKGSEKWVQAESRCMAGLFDRTLRQLAFRTDSQTLA
jgi:hypothetical protein